MNQSLICPLSEGGAIDPEGFRDKDGSHYLLYKIDGNSLNAGNDSLHSTPIMLQPVKSDGISLLDKPTALLDRGPEDGPLIEAPAMARYERAGDKGDLYVLYYSSNMYDAPSYDIGYATSDGGVKGPFNKSTARLLMTGDADGKLIGPGGMDVGIGNGKVTFHSILSKDPLKRTMWTGYISFNEAR